MIGKNIRDYLSNLEQGRIDIEKFCLKYSNYKNYRSEVNAEIMMEIGIRIWMEDFQKGVYGNAEETQDWINIVWEKLYKKYSRMVNADIDIALNNVFNRNIIAQNVLEDNINYSLDFFKLLHQSHQALLWRYFVGFGVVKVGWDKWDTRQGWETGIPIIRNIDPRSIFINPNIQQDNMTDITCIFEQFTYDKELLYEKIRSGAWGISGEKAEEIIKAIDSNNEHNDLLDNAAMRNTYNNDLVTVVICQYQKPEYVTVRKLKNYIGKDQTIYEALEDELSEIVGKDKLDKITDKDDDTALPEGMRASEPEVVKYNAWYEFMFVPGTKTVIVEPYCVGDKTSYVFLTGVRNPDSSYPISDAYRQARSQDIFNRTLTQYLVHALMQHHSIPMVVREGLVHPDEFLDNLEEQDIIGDMDETWFRENGGQLPVKWLQPRQVSPALTQVLNMMQMAISESTASTPILAGESQGSHASGAQVAILGQNAIDSSRAEFFLWQLFLTNICELLKEYVAEYKNYIHIAEYFGMEILVNANASTNMLNVAPNCYVTVMDATGKEEMEEIKAQKYERLYLQGIVPYEIAVQNMNLENPDEIISIHQQQEPIYNMVKKLEARPELLPKLLALVDQMMSQQEQPTAEAAQQQNEQTT